MLFWCLSYLLGDLAALSLFLPVIWNYLFDVGWAWVFSCFVGVV